MEQGRSKWERADSVASGVGTVARGIGWVMIRIYALLLIGFGVLCFMWLDGFAKAAGLLFVGYGLYLMFGGTWIIY